MKKKLIILLSFLVSAVCHQAYAQDISINVVTQPGTAFSNAPVSSLRVDICNNSASPLEIPASELLASIGVSGSDVMITGIEAGSDPGWDISGTPGNEIELSNTSVTLSEGTCNTLFLTLQGSGAVTGQLTISSTISFSAGSALVDMLPENDGSVTSFGVESSLPVKLANFDVQKEGSLANLQWSTTEEVNTDRFEIERSGNGINWARVGIEKATGNSTILSRYSFADQTPLRGVNYYRLKMVDLDGSSEYSDIRSLAWSDQSGISLYPNPATSGFRILGSGSGQIKEVVLHSLTGQVLQRASANLDHDINISHLPVGLYTISVTQQDGQISTHKILKK